MIESFRIETLVPEEAILTSLRDRVQQGSRLAAMTSEKIFWGAVSGDRFRIMCKPRYEAVRTMYEPVCRGRVIGGASGTVVKLSLRPSVLPATSLLGLMFLAAVVCVELARPQWRRWQLDPSISTFLGGLGITVCAFGIPVAIYFWQYRRGRPRRQEIVNLIVSVTGVSYERWSRPA